MTGRTGNTVATILRTPVSAENNDFSGKDDDTIGTCFLLFVGLSDPTGGTDNVSLTNLRVSGGSALTGAVSIFTVRGGVDNLGFIIARVPRGVPCAFATLTGALGDVCPRKPPWTSVVVVGGCVPSIAFVPAATSTRGFG